MYIRNDSDVPGTRQIPFLCDSTSCHPNLMSSSILSSLILLPKYLVGCYTAHPNKFYTVSFQVRLSLLQSLRPQCRHYYNPKSPGYEDYRSGQNHVSHHEYNLLATTHICSPSQSHMLRPSTPLHTHLPQIPPPLHLVFSNFSSP